MNGDWPVAGASGSVVLQRIPAGYSWLPARTLGSPAAAGLAAAHVGQLCTTDRSIPARLLMTDIEKKSQPGHILCRSSPQSPKGAFLSVPLLSSTPTLCCFPGTVV